MQRESDLVRLLRKNFEDRGAVVTKMHGSIYNNGIPDLDVLWKDYHLKLEAKFDPKPKSKISLLVDKLDPRQKYFLMKCAESNPHPKHIIVGLIGACMLPTSKKHFALFFVDPRSNYFRKGVKIQVNEAAEDCSLVTADEGRLRILISKGKTIYRLLPNFFDLFNIQSTCNRDPLEWIKPR